jgi:glucan biosynthesis protein C
MTTDRHYGMDWLRIGAFGLLILYHVGMAFVPWDYEVKLADPPIAWATIPMFLTNPWRLSLLFLVSGYASAAILARDPDIGGFVRSRLARLGIPLLFGMAVIVTPQPWVNLVTQHDYPHGFGWFMAHDYYAFQFIDGIAMPTWMHLWFVVYLLAYTLVLAALLALPKPWRDGGRRAAERLLAGVLLLPLPMLYIGLVRSFLPPGWSDSHHLIDDASAHAAYLFCFMFGVLLRRSDVLRAAIGRQWPIAAVLAVLAYAAIAGFEIAYPGDTPLPPEFGPVYRTCRAVEMWGAIVALLGIADRYWNRDSRWRPILAEAVFPFYIIHQTVIVVVGYWLLFTATSPLERFIVLIAATVAGCWLFYDLGRRVGWLRPLIGLKASRSRGASQPG